MTKKTEEIVNIIIDYLESENIYAGTPETTAVVQKWENHYPHLDNLSLAALALANPNEIQISDSEIREFKEFFFPSENSKFHYYSIKEEEPIIW